MDHHYETSWQLFIQFFEVVSICYYNNDFSVSALPHPMTTFLGIRSLLTNIATQ